MTAAIGQTAACEADRHHLCRGKIMSLTAAQGAACGCTCHGTDDRAIEPPWKLTTSTTHSTSATGTPKTAAG